ncbi:hypothetical protein [Moorena producens]|uniref:hypothetical protein n=1 Tax=Moorena producens TaxID=1155739 RepID=UPI003C754B06
MTTTQILSQAEQLISTLKQLMPTIYQQETLESILGLFLCGQGNSVPHHCQTKSESALSRFFNYCLDAVAHGGNHASCSWGEPRQSLMV